MVKKLFIINNMQKPKRIPKSKEELKAQMAHLQMIEHQKKVVRMIFPVLADMKTIYDAQTVVNALSGFIKAALAEKQTQYKVRDFDIDLSKEKKSAVKDKVIEVCELLAGENADDVTALLDRFGSGLGQYGAKKYLENPMKVIKMEDFVA